MFVCTCNVKSYEYKGWTKHAFIYESNFKPLHQSKCCGALIDNRADALIFVLEDKEKETKEILRYALIELFGGLCYVEYVYKITPCYFIVIIYISLLKK